MSPKLWQLASYFSLIWNRVKSCIRNSISGIIEILGLLWLSVVYDINSCRYGLCWNVSVNTNKIIRFISQTLFSHNIIIVIFLASIVHE